MRRCPVRWLACTSATLLLLVVASSASAQASAAQFPADPAQLPGVPQYREAIDVVGVRPIDGLARIVNLFDAHYSTFGLLGEADDVLGDEFEEPEFFSPGAPRAAWVGLQVTLP